jgi:hypothetical protein
MIERFFLDHPSAVGESYAEHFLVASGFGARMVAGGLACVVHAVVPALFVATASRTVSALYQRMHRRAAPPRAGWTPDYQI